MLRNQNHENHLEYIHLLDHQMQKNEHEDDPLWCLVSNDQQTASEVSHPEGKKILKINLLLINQILEIYLPPPHKGLTDYQHL